MRACVRLYLPVRIRECANKCVHKRMRLSLLQPIDLVILPAVADDPVLPSRVCVHAAMRAAVHAAVCAPVCLCVCAPVRAAVRAC